MAFLFGGAEPLSVFLAQGLVLDSSGITNKLEERRSYTNIRKLPLCCVQHENPLRQILLIGKDSLQGPRNGRGIVHGTHGYR